MVGIMPFVFFVHLLHMIQGIYFSLVVHIWFYCVRFSFFQGFIKYFVHIPFGPNSRLNDLYLVEYYQK